MIGPTARQLDALRFVAQHTRERGYPPSTREIGDALGIDSTNGVRDHLFALERKGLLRITPMTARDIVLTEPGRALIEGAEQPTAAAPPPSTAHPEGGS